MRDAYQQDLAALRDSVHGFGDDALDQFDEAIAAIETADEARARRVVDGDEALNTRYLELERDCIHFLGLQQPVAGDLRLVTASFKILTDFERIGDLAAGLAERTPLEPVDGLPTLNVRDLANIAREMVVAALDAYETGDADRCEAVVDQMDELDGLCQRVAVLIVRSLVEFEANDAATEPAVRDATQLLLVVRDINRVGDHAVNVAARAFYMIESSDQLLY